MKKLILIGLLFISPAQAQESDSSSSSTLDSACRREGFSCGECESGLQNDMNELLTRISGGALKQGDHWGDLKEKNDNPSNIPMAAGVTLEKTLQEIINIYKKNNPLGDNKLNFVVIGESESLQGSSIKNGKIYPRIMLKSPDSELMVTFNTDPAAKGYNTLEMMRWNGKKGRYEFQELNFGSEKEKPRIDATGTKCMECHKESPRPNWDTYRAWAGVVPSRDDMLEMHGENKSFNRAKGMQPDARAYINFLEQMADDKDSGKKTRIAMLDIPFDKEKQLGEYVKRAGKQKLSNREKLDIIKQRVKEDGFYRIRHYPDKEDVRDKGARMPFNFDEKTADRSGPSQFAFDQMLAQNMCKVTTDLKRHKDFDKFKHGLALIMACGAGPKMPEIYPESFKAEVLDYYNKTRFASLQDIDKSKVPAKVSTFDEMDQLLRLDTSASHDNANGFKFNRHERFLKNYLKNVEKQAPTVAAETARFYSEKVSTPMTSPYHAIEDFGGVRGVPEDSTEIMASTRILLEKFGVNVGHWSMVHGKSNAYNSFSFSDQFVLFKTQPIWNQLKNEAGGCEELEKKTRESLSAPESLIAPISPPSTNTSEIAVLCRGAGRGIASAVDERNLQELESIAAAEVRASMKKSMQKCLSCHDTDGDIEFPGLKKFVTGAGAEEEAFVDFLSTQNDYYKRPMWEVFQIKLGVIPRPNDGLDWQGDMPPSAWKDNADFAKKHGLPPESVQVERRKALGMFLTVVAKEKDQESLKVFCDSVNNGDYIKDFTIPKPGSGAPGQEAGKQ